MLYKGESEVKILLVNVRDLQNVCLDAVEDKIKSELNSVDYDLVYKGTHEIDLLEFDVINDNNNQVFNNSNSDMKYGKILKLVYKVQSIKKIKKEIK